MSIALNIKNLISGDADINSTTDLAKKTGISKQVLHSILSGKSKNPRKETVESIASYFNCSVDELMGIREHYSISSELKKIMLILNLTDYQLAEKTEQSRSTIRTILSNRGIMPRDETLIPICNYLGISLENIKGYTPIDYPQLKNKFSTKTIVLLRHHNLNNFKTLLRMKNSNLQRINSLYSVNNQFAIKLDEDLKYNNELRKITIFLSTDIINNEPILVYYPKNHLLLSGLLIEKNKNIFQPENIMLDSFVLDDNYQIIGAILGISTN